MVLKYLRVKVAFCSEVCALWLRVCIRIEIRIQNVYLAETMFLTYGNSSSYKNNLNKKRLINRFSLKDSKLWMSCLIHMLSSTIFLWAWNSLSLCPQLEQQLSWFITLFIKRIQLKWHGLYRRCLHLRETSFSNLHWSTWSTM
jgi:hypothetical protein